MIRFEDGDRKFVKGVLLSNSCDINPNIKRELPSKVTFVPVIRLSRYAELLANSGIGNEKIKNKIVAIKEQKVSTLFYLPQGAKLEEDYVALLDDVHTLPFVAFQAEKDQRKLFTLSQVGFYLFLLKLSVHFCRFHENVDRSQA